MASGPDQQHVFYRGTDDHIHHLLWDPSSKRVFADDWTLPTRVPLSAGDPAAMASERQQHVFYRSRDGHIQHVVWIVDKRRLYRDVWTAARGAKLAEGDPVTMVTPGQQHVFYRGPGGSICHIFWDASTGKLTADDWTEKAGAPPAAGDPAVLVTPGQQHVFYRGKAGGVQHILWDAASGFHTDDWLRARGAPQPEGNIATMATAGQQHVFYRANRAIHHILWSPVSGTLHHDEWTARSFAGAADGDPATMVTDEGQQHVFYRGTAPGGVAGAEIHHIFWDPSSPQQLRFDDWTARAHAGSPASGVPATMQSSGQQHVFYRGQGGAVDHILWSPSSPSTLAADDWTSRGFAPMAAGNPATLVTSDAPTDYTWTILPLGDSITEGFQGDKGGYRVPLFETVTHHGKRLRFVGTQFDAPPNPTINGVPFTQFHEGHSGNHIDQIASLVPGVLSAEPDIILLMIGTNDVLPLDARYPPIVDQAPDRLDALLGKIIDSQVGALIVVAQIPPIPSFSNLVDAYNRRLVDVVQKRIAAGERILLADMHTGFPLNFLSADGIHPHQQGYNHIASVWYAVLDTVLT